MNTVRRSEIIHAAYELIVERGLEGFRVRAVADRVGINHATLLHYFASKNDLLDAVIDHLLDQLRKEGMRHETRSPLEVLRTEFDDMRRRILEDPDFFVVLYELQLRARRDPDIARRLERMHEAWRRHLVRVIEEGQEAKQLRATLPVSMFVDTFMAQFRGFSMEALGCVVPERLNSMIEIMWNMINIWIVERDLAQAPEESNGVE
ncbi:MULTISPECIES: TetR/AcrR family transcriptional regulator [Alicyclobacillus]|uniref:AcrR family transcriptional regulator n=1 Tax=Alicyclobacillus tolerans TaxID=90970 RepID=A0ABT9LZ93_9BACL|nr:MULTISPECIES: TetR/AcrR family transcriptional regulator [Alicyclobacillus]MDP9729584.1 AcrR family transcriptional regulator [Alicyclobacillus tengchongensis]